MKYGPGKRNESYYLGARHEIQSLQKKVPEKVVVKKMPTNQTPQKVKRPLVVGDIGTKLFRKAVADYRDDGIMKFTPTLPGRS